jgi:hypothetical protein
VEYTTADYRYLLQAVDEDTAGTDGDDESEEDEKEKDKRTETKEVSFSQRKCTVLKDCLTRWIWLLMTCMVSFRSGLSRGGGHLLNF